MGSQVVYRCSRCGSRKPVGEFNWNRVKRRPDTYCRPCRAAYGKEHYAKNKQRYIDNAYALKRRMLEERIEFLIDYLKSRPCVDCGEVDPLVLDFDHVGDKSFSISTALPLRKWAVVLAEIEKCVVRCANCHRRKTARERGFTRAVIAERRRESDETGTG